MSKKKHKRKEEGKPVLNKKAVETIQGLQASDKFKALTSMERGELYYNMLLHSGNLARGALAGRLGQSFDGERNLYKAAGYKEELTFEDYYARYRRGDIAKKIVDFYSEESWSTFPSVYDNEEGEQSPFEKEVKSLVDDLHLQEYFKRVDKLSGIGEFAVLFLGFDDGKEFSQPADRAGELLYLTPYKQNNVEIVQYVKDKTDPRFGLPEMYEIQMKQGGGNTTGIKVHYSRILHVAENPEECDYIGTPRLEDIYNRLQDIETIMAGASEMFWKGGFTGTIYEIDKDFDIAPDDLDKIQESIGEFEHDLKRYLLMKGVTGKQLPPSVESPKDHIDVELDLIAGTKGIPKRILIGTEEGRLAGEQDSEHLMGRVANRRETFANSVIIRPFFDRLIEVGVLSSPKDDSYKVEWPDVDADTDKEKVELAKGMVDVMAVYIEKGIDNLIPPDYFLTKVLHFEKEEADEILMAMSEYYQEEETPEEEE